MTWDFWGFASTSLVMFVMPKVLESLVTPQRKNNFLPSVFFVLGFFFLGRLRGISPIKHTHTKQKRLPKFQCREQSKGTFSREDLSLSSLGPANFYTLGEGGKNLTKSKKAYSIMPVAHCWSVILETATLKKERNSDISNTRKVGSQNIHLITHIFQPPCTQVWPETGLSQYTVRTDVQNIERASE